MYTTVRDALDQLLGFVGELGDTEARRVGLSLLNSALYDIWMAHAWLDYQSPAPFEITLTRGRSRYALPAHAGRLLRPVLNRTVKGAAIDAADAEMTAQLYPGMGTTDTPTGRPCHYRLTGITGVLRQPEIEGEALEVVSDNTLDRNVLVTIAGDDAEGVQRIARVTLVGTVAVPVGTFTFVDEFAKATIETVTPTPGTSSRGTVTIRKTSDGTVLQTLGPYESAREHKIVQFYPSPSHPDVIAVPFMRRPRQLVAESDPIPGDWWNAIQEAWEIRYRINTGEMTLDANVPRPHLRRMVEDDNLLRPQPRKVPYS